MATPFVEDLSMLDRCPAADGHIQPTDFICSGILRLYACDSVSLVLFGYKKIVKSATGLMFCLVFSDIFRSHCVTVTCIFTRNRLGAEGENGEQKILGLRELGSSAVCGHDDARDWRQ